MVYSWSLIYVKALKSKLAVRQQLIFLFINELIENLVDPFTSISFAFAATYYTISLSENRLSLASNNLFN